MKKLKYYCLPKKMNNATLQEKTACFDFITEERFIWTTDIFFSSPEASMDMFGFTAKEKQRYIFQMLMDNGDKVSALLRLTGDKMQIGASIYDPNLWWEKGDILLYYIDE